ncbi:hypothetical protein NIES4075_62760 [Tolypothrix sp. NIES-4075]|uniref:hypothetical protein n=1 Tax=Tolypothrix sp. NIES-4075 TaxID=2005459 RepID=UPI000B5D0647|nr:hypothetical protein [Tolypothrix sp. NIES-4075]GAX45255.1 hypothetical protein NIES4075_62760 [Tolypothrix sp. NIES-4075]
MSGIFSSKVNNSRERLENIENRLNIFQQQFSNCIGTLNILKKEFEELKKESLEELNQGKKIGELEREISHLKNQLLQQKENHSAVYDPKDKKPQHYTLSQTFEKLRDDFNSLSDKLYACCYDSDFKKNRRDATAKIKHVLSQEILVNAMKRVSANSQNITAQQNQEVCRVIQEHLEKLGWKCDKKEDFPTQDCLKLIEEGFRLVKDMASLNPPGRLVWYEKEGEEFNKDKHELMQGSDEKGKISLIMHPGYMEGDKVIIRALVLTN